MQIQIRRGPGTLYRRLQSIRFLVTRDRNDLVDFVSAPLGIARRERLALIRRFTTATNHVRGYHTLGEMLAVTRAILARAGRPGLTVVEAGCAFGSSTAKLSLATRAAGGQLHVFDSFRGIPANAEHHVHLDGRPIQFRAGAYRATLPSVRRAVARYGAPEVVQFAKGLFEQTMPAMLPAQPIDVAVLDVDLLASTRHCIAQLFPRLAPDGVLFSLDGQLRATHDLLASPRFWREEVGVEMPHIEGLGGAKLLTIRARRSATAGPVATRPGKPKSPLAPGPDLAM